MDRLFVFGTLKEDFPNSHLNQGHRIPGTFTTLEPYPLYLVGERHSPWLINEPGQGETVQGELYQVNEQQLEMMDILERIHLNDGYQRMTINVQQIETSKTLEAFCYLKSHQQLNKDEIRLGPLSFYNHEHAQYYQFRKIE